jgi:hypothetical protein
VPTAGGPDPPPGRLSPVEPRPEAPIVSEDCVAAALDVCRELVLVEEVVEPKREVADRNAAELETGAPDRVLDDEVEVPDAEEEGPPVDEEVEA